LHAILVNPKDLYASVWFMLADSEIKSVITAFFAARRTNHLAILFGSGARGILSPISDIDLGVLEVPELTTEESISIADGLAKLTGREIDVVNLSTAHGAILSEILGSGAVLKNTDPVAYEQLINRVLWEHADDSRIGTHILEERMKKWQNPTKS
jgi:predicted nucleotidyltransferase